MNLLEMNDAILFGKKNTVEVPIPSKGNLDTFQSLINSGKSIKMFYDQTDDANSFFALFPDVRQIVGSKICVECFYACKVGYFMGGVPSKLLYIVTKMLSRNEAKVFVNRSINSAVQLLKPYMSNEYVLDGQKYTVKDVIENVAGAPVKLLNTSIRKTKVGQEWEVFIPEVNRVAILPAGLGELLSMTDCENLRYVRELGIVLHDVPIRVMGNRVGITTDDFDLRNCF